MGAKAKDKIHSTISGKDFEPQDYDVRRADDRPVRSPASLMARLTILQRTASWQRKNKKKNEGNGTKAPSRTGRRSPRVCLQVCTLCMEILRKRPYVGTRLIRRCVNSEPYRSAYGFRVFNPMWPPQMTPSESKVPLNDGCKISEPTTRERNPALSRREPQYRERTFTLCCQRASVSAKSTNKQPAADNTRQLRARFNRRQQRVQRA